MFTRTSSGFDLGVDSHNAVWGDFANDGYVDLFVSTVGTSNYYYHNKRDGTFAKSGSGSVINTPSAGCVNSTIAGISTTMVP
jgi:hypothetical protein